MLDKVLDFPLQIWLVPGMFIAFLLGGTDRQGYLNPWGLFLMLPFYLLGYITLVVVLFVSMVVPVLIVLYTPICVFIADNSCIESILTLFR